MKLRPTRQADGAEDPEDDVAAVSAQDDAAALAEDNSPGSDDQDTPRAGEDAPSAGEDGTEQEAPGGSPVDNRRMRGMSPRGAVAVLAVVVVVLAAAVVWEMLQTLNSDAATAAGQDAQSAARAAAQAIMSYDYRTLTSDMAKARSMTTGAFRRQYEADAPRLLQIARQYKGITRADVWAAGTQSQSPSQVTVILFVDQTTTQASDKTPRLSENRVEMVMRKVGGNWLAAGMQAL
ncbi:MAG: hypothetical protein ACM3ML_23420 [Micromonosporaceae bacterium]